MNNNISALHNVNVTELAKLYLADAIIQCNLLKK